MSKKCIVKITYEVLHSMLELPDDVEITGVAGPEEFDDWYFRVRLEGEPVGIEVAEGAKIPVVDPIITLKDGRKVWDFRSDLFKMP